MTEKESAHPLSPSVNVDIGKTNNLQNSLDNATDTATSNKSNSIIPVCIYFYICI